MMHVVYLRPNNFLIPATSQVTRAKTVSLNVCLYVQIQDGLCISFVYCTESYPILSKLKSRQSLIVIFPE